MSGTAGSTLHDAARSTSGPATGHIERQLRSLRRRLRSYISLTATAHIVIWMALCFWLVLALDYLPVRLAGADELPQAARACLLGLSMLGALTLLFQGWLRPWWRPLTTSQLAMLLERRFPQLAEALITAVELPVHGDRPAGTRAMLQRVRASAEQQLQSLPVHRVLDYGPLRRQMFLAAAFVLTLGAATAISPGFYRLAFARLLGLDNTPWPREAYLEAIGFVNGQRKIARGDDLVIQVRADASRRVPPPDTCLLYYQTADGDRGRAVMTREGSPVDGYQIYQYSDRPFRNLISDVRMDIVGHDYRLRGLLIKALDSPTFRNAQLEITPPAYTHLSARTESPRDGLRVPQGTQVRFRAHASQALQSIVVRNLALNTEDAIDLSTDDASLPFTRDLGVVSAPLILEFQLIDRDGLRSQEPYRLTLGVIPDEPPQLNVTYRGIGTAVTPVARIPVSGTIQDDYGLTRVTARTAVTGPEAAEPVPHEFPAPLPDGEAWSYALDLQEPETASALTLVPGAKLGVVIEALDNSLLSDRPHATEVAFAVLDVVRREELLAIIEGRELGLRRRFEQMIQEMAETRDTLVRVRTEIADTSKSIAQLADTQELRMRRLDSHSRRAQPELDGMAASYADIWAELRNNRVDTPELEDRIAIHLVQPLGTLAEQSFPRYAETVKSLRAQWSDSAAVDREAFVVQCEASLAEADRVLLEMRELLSQMLQLEEFNELIDLVREMLRQQESLLEDTETLRKKSLLDLLND